MIYWNGLRICIYSIISIDQPNFKWGSYLGCSEQSMNLASQKAVIVSNQKLHWQCWQEERVGKEGLAKLLLRNYIDWNILQFIILLKLFAYIHRFDRPAGASQNLLRNDIRLYGPLWTETERWQHIIIIYLLKPPQIKKWWYILDRNPWYSTKKHIWPGLWFLPIHHLCSNWFQKNLNRKV